MTDKNNEKDKVVLGCLLLICVVLIVVAIFFAAMAFLSWLICLAFDLTWSWFIPLGITAVIAMLWIIKNIL